MSGRECSADGAAPWSAWAWTLPTSTADLRRVQLGDGDLAGYFTKIAHEVTGSHRKEGRRAGGRTPMQLLADAVDSYEESAVAR